MIQYSNVLTNIDLFLSCVKTSGDRHSTAAMVVAAGIFDGSRSHISALISYIT